MLLDPTIKLHGYTPLLLRLNLLASVPPNVTLPLYVPELIVTVMEATKLPASIAVGKLIELFERPIAVTTGPVIVIGAASVPEIAPEPAGHGLPLSKCEAYNRVYSMMPIRATCRQRQARSGSSSMCCMRALNAISMWSLQPWLKYGQTRSSLPPRHSSRPEASTSRR